MKIFLISFAVVGLFLACNNDDKFDNAVTENAVVLLTPYPNHGNCEYLIEINDGKTFFLENLPAEFQIDSLGIKVSFIKTGDIKHCGGFIGSHEVIECSNIELR